MNGGVQRQQLAAILMPTRPAIRDRWRWTSTVRWRRSRQRGQCSGRGRRQPRSRHRHLGRLHPGGVRFGRRGSYRGARRAGLARCRTRPDCWPVLRFRIGVHLGDVIETADSASTATASTSPRGCRRSPSPAASWSRRRCVARSRVASRRRSRIAALQGVKNIGDPVRAYAVTGGPRRCRHRRGRATRPRRQLSRRLGAGAMAAALAVAVALYAWWRRSHRSRAVATSPQPAAPSASPAPARVGQDVDRRAAVRQHERRSRAALFRGWHHRRPDHRSLEGQRLVRDRPPLHLRLQRQGARCTRDRAKTRRAIRARGQRAQERHRGPRQRAAHRRRDRRSRLGRSLRRRPEEHLRVAGHGHAQRRQGARGDLEQGGRATTSRAAEPTTSRPTTYS